MTSTKQIRLGDVCSFVRGPFGGSLKKSIFVEAGKAVYEQQHAIGDQFSEVRYFITEEKFEEMRRFELQPLDLIMSCSGTMGKVAIAPQGIAPGIINQALLKMSTTAQLSVWYLRYWMSSPHFQDELSKHTKGVAIKNVASVKVLKEIAIPVPPLPEQERIVAILDEAFEGIATATAHAERNLHNARELFQSVLQSTFQQKGEDWVETTLGDACKMYQPKTISKKDLVEDGPYPVFGANGIIGQYDQFNHQDPQVLVTCRGATCGAVNVSDPFSWITGNAMVVQPLNANLNLRFLEYALRGGVDLSPAITGAAQPQITRTNLNPTPFGYPQSIKTQKAIVQKLDALVTETRRLEAIYQRKLAALAELKQSLLQRAFAGEL